MIKEREKGSVGVISADTWDRVGSPANGGVSLNLEPRKFVDKNSPRH